MGAGPVLKNTEELLEEPLQLGWLEGDGWLGKEACHKLPLFAQDANHVFMKCELLASSCFSRREKFQKIKN